MSFSHVDCITYSTCSVNVEENEAVVSKALAEANQSLEGGERWQLVAPANLTGWQRRGKECEGLTKDQANAMCRCDPFDGDESNGFFLSYFERVRGTCTKDETATKASYPRADDVNLSVYEEGMFVERDEQEANVKVNAKVKANAKRKAKNKPGVGSVDDGENKKRKIETNNTKDGSDKLLGLPTPPSNIPRKALKKMRYKAKQRAQKAARLAAKKAAS